MSTKSIIRVQDVMKTDFDLVDGMDTVADALRKLTSGLTNTPKIKSHDVCI